MQRPIEDPDVMQYTFKTLENSVKKILVYMYGGQDKDALRNILKLYQAQVQETLDTMGVYHSSLLKERDAQCYCLAV